MSQHPTWSRSTSETSWVPSAVHEMAFRGPSAWPSLTEMDTEMGAKTSALSEQKNFRAKKNTGTFLGCQPRKYFKLQLLKRTGLLRKTKLGRRADAGTSRRPCPNRGDALVATRRRTPRARAAAGAAAVHHRPVPGRWKLCKELWIPVLKLWAARVLHDHRGPGDAHNCNVLQCRSKRCVLYVGPPCDQ